MLLRRLNELVPALAVGPETKDADIGAFAAKLAAELKLLRGVLVAIEPDGVFPGELLSLFPRDRRLAVLNSGAEYADWRFAAAVRLFRLLAGVRPGATVAALDRELAGAESHPAVRRMGGAAEFLRRVLSGATVAGPERHLAEGLTFGAARVANFVGSGSTSIVYRAFRHGRECALKLPRPGAEGRFLNEQGLLLRLRHPNLPRLLAWEGGASPYILMEFCRTGRSVRERGAGAGFRRALDYLHGAGVLHGDLRFGNLGIAADGRPVLCTITGQS